MKAITVQAVSAHMKRQRVKSRSGVSHAEKGQVWVMLNNLPLSSEIEKVRAHLTERIEWKIQKEFATFGSYVFLLSANEETKGERL